jgi:predicted extracellular nuclease
MPTPRRLIVLLAALALAAPAPALAYNLFISEYVEGSSFNKAIEIYNPTTVPVDLGTWSIQVFFNGSMTAGATVTLPSIVLPPGEAYVVAHPTAAFAVTADVTNTGINFNGDDAVTLRDGTTVVDAIGQIGVDPGAEWGTGNTSTADNTIRRNPGDCSGDTNGGDVFDPSTQWTGYIQDPADGLGAHTAACADVPAAPAPALAAMSGLLLGVAALAVRRRSKVA